MPDMTLCVRDDCPARQECKRWRGNWDVREEQSYFEAAPWIRYQNGARELMHCPDFVPLAADEGR